MKLYSIQLILGLIITISSVSNAGNGGPPGEIVFHDFLPCEYEDIEPIPFQAEFVDSDDGRALTINFTVPTDVSRQDLHVIFISDRWEDGAWNENIYSTEDKLDTMTEKYMRTAFNNALPKFEPPLYEGNMILAGDYMLTIFHQTMNDVDLKQILYGRFKVKILVMMNDDKGACFTLVVDSIAP